MTVPSTQRTQMVLHSRSGNMTTTTTTTAATVTHNSDYENTSELNHHRDQFTPTPLHMLATAHNINWGRLLSRIESHPHEASIQDTHGFTVLHHVCARRECPPLHIIQSLLKAHPKATSLLTTNGNSILSLACWRRVPYNVLKIVLDANPGMAQQCDVHNVYPVVALWNSYVKHVFDGDEDKLFDSVCCSGEGFKLWIKLDLILRASYAKKWYRNDTEEQSNQSGESNNNGNNMEKDVTEKEWSVVHGAAGTPWCPRPLLKLAMRVHPEQVRHPDSFGGRLPLHVAASLPYSETPSYIHECADETDIDILVSAYPRGAKTRDATGRLPLHIATESGRRWDEGLGCLVRAAPEALQSRDYCCHRTSSVLSSSTTTAPSTRVRLYPFMIGALSERASIDTVYELLRAAPHLVNTC